MPSWLSGIALDVIKAIVSNVVGAEEDKIKSWVKGIVLALSAHVSTHADWAGVAPQDVHQFFTSNAPVAAPTSEGG